VISRRLFLVGLRGTGKTTVGRMLAAERNWAFADTDEFLQRQWGTTIAEMFAAVGEAVFRKRESTLFHDLSQADDVVIATGGGIVLDARNRYILQTKGLCIWLTGEPETLWRRLMTDPATRDSRPRLTGQSGLNEVWCLAKEREPLYREVAHLTVSTEGRSPEEVVSAILSAWPSS
jgi:shikimate kinase